MLQDVYILFRLGKRALLKALLEMKDIFDHHDVYYVYSKIWLDDYCTWIQHARYVRDGKISCVIWGNITLIPYELSDHVLRTLAHELHHFTVNKSDIGWDLEDIETVSVFGKMRKVDSKKLYFIDCSANAARTRRGTRIEYM